MDNISTRELYEKIWKSDGYAIKQKIDELSLSKTVLDSNFSELVDFIKEYEENKEILTDGVLNRKLKNEIVRLVQNYVASDYSYIEHAERVVKHLDDEELLSAFYEKRGKMWNDESVAFVRDLRRYSQHCGIIQQTTLIRFTRANMDQPLSHSDTSVVLMKENLMKWKDWKSKSNSFIKKMDNQVKLIIPLTRQFKILNAFHEWLFDEIFLRFEKQIEQYNSIIKHIMERKSSTRAGGLNNWCLRCLE